MTHPENKDFEYELQRYLWKSELVYRSKMRPQGSCVQWLTPYCATVAEISDFLRFLGFRIHRVVDERDSDGSVYRWVETVNGVIVYANTADVQGLVAGRSQSIL